MSLITPIRKIFAVRKPPLRTEAIMYGTNAYSGEYGPTTPYVHPDELAHQQGIDIYRTMQRRDDMVSACFAYAHLASLSTGDQVEPGQTEEGDETAKGKAEEAAQFVDDALDSLPMGRQQFFLDCLDAQVIGFVVLEKIWGDVLTDGRWAGKRMFRAMRHRNPKYIDFQVDEHGEIAEDGIWQESIKTTWDKFSLDDVLYWAWNPKDDNPYGNPPTRAAYRYYWTKDNVIVKSWARYLERYGMPLVDGQYPEGAGDTAKQVLRDLVKSMRDSLTFIRPENWKVNITPMPHEAQITLYVESMAACNRGIARAIWLPELVMEIGNNVGSYALGKQHNNQFVWILNYIRNALEHVVNSQYVAPLMAMNFDASYPIPYWSMKPFAEDDMLSKAQLVEILVKAGFPMSTRKISELFSMPLPEEGEDVLKPSAQPQQYQMPGMEEKEASDYTEMAWDAAHGKLEPRKVHVRMGGNGNGKKYEPSPVERMVNFAQINVDEDVATAFWGDTAAVVLEGAASDLERDSGKGNGARRFR